MLRREEAQKRLEEFAIKDWEDKALRRVGKLPARAAEVGRGLFERDAAGRPIKDWRKRREAAEAAGLRLDRLSVRDRRQLFDALFPKLGEQLEAGWRLCDRLPYEVGYSRKAFRAPSDREATRTARVGWFRLVKSELAGYDP